MGSEFDSGLNPAKVIVGGRLDPKAVYPDVTVKLVTKGYQRLGIEEYPYKTEMEKQMPKIPLRDAAIETKGGAGIPYRGVIEGKFKGKATVKDILNHRDSIKKSQTITEAKLRKPIAVPMAKTIKEKGVAINLADPNYVRLDDLSFQDQKKVVGTSDLLSQKAPKEYPAIGIPPGGYDIKKPNRLTMTRAQVFNTMERGAGRYGQYISSRRRGENPFMMPRRRTNNSSQLGGRKTNNDVQLVVDVNANNKFQEGLLGAKFGQ